MLMIRFQRIGRVNDPAYRISVLEKERAARAGHIVESLGSYNPKTKAFAVDEARVKEWLAHGAQPTATVKNLFIAKGIMSGKKADVFPASARKKAAEAAAAAEAEKAAATPAVPETPTEASPAEAAPETPAEAAAPAAEEKPAA